MSQKIKKKLFFIILRIKPKSKLNKEIIHYIKKKTFLRQNLSLYKSLKI